ncbi:MAG: hypothetical protein MK105_03715 [Crocinitomicaceae bacterium]|nr:hypothetical protein [Crocinitomicaceae bacterium]
MSAFDRLLNQIDGFIRKFYKNQIVKGLLLFTGVLIASYLFVITLEYFGRFGTLIRGFLLFSFIGVNTFIIVRFLVLPLLRLKSYGSRINRKQASTIIGDFFPDVSDRLLNTLQLHDQMNENSAEFELLNASVQQRSAALSVLPFSEAIDIRANSKYLKLLFPIVLLLLVIGLVSPAFLSRGTERVVNFSTEFVEPAPFKFRLLNESLIVEEGQDVLLDLELVGSELPQNVYLISDKGRFVLKKIAKNSFQARLTQVRESTTFSFEANDFKSKSYDLVVLGKTALSKLEARIEYPGYLGKDNEVIQNANGLVVEEGTSITWSILTKNSSVTSFGINGVTSVYNEAGFEHMESFVDDANCLILMKNKQSLALDSTSFQIQVIKDEFPSISVQEKPDSLKDGVRYFSGSVGDDYGVRSLSFIYKIKSESGIERTESIEVGGVVGTESPFVFSVDFRRENLELSDDVTYYFVVGDNDGVNGSKLSSSRKFKYEVPDLEELNDIRSDVQEKSKKGLQNVLERAAEFNRNVDELKKDILNDERNSWDNQNEVNQLQEEQQSLLDDLKSIQEEIKNSLQEKNQLSEMDKELLEQHELINDLLDDLMDDELREMLKELEDLLKSKNKEAVDDKLDELEMSSEDMRSQLDRSLEMLKKLQVNEKLDDISKELKQLANRQDELKEKTRNSKNISEEDKKEQKDINEAFEDLRKDMNDLDSLNSELDRPLQLDSQDEKKQLTSDDLKKAQEELNDNKGKKAAEDQNGASEKMKEMAESLEQMKSESQQQEAQEDLDMLRNILESLVSLSLDQEEVISSFKRVSDNDPSFYNYSKQQRKSIDNTIIVRDSLYALAKRQPKIAKFIDGELNGITSNQELILEDIDERRSKELANHQQYVMTSFNNLALLLNESLADMQKQLANQKPGSGSCNKPGGKGKPSPGSGNPGDMKELLKKQLEDLKKGNQSGGDKPGDNPGSKPGGKNGSGTLGFGNKQIAKMAAQQSAMRKALEKMRGEMNKDGKGAGNALNPLIQELKEQEQDLINKRLGNNLINRQKKILTRLLESEKAMIERGLDQKRESKEGFSNNNGNQIRFDEYNKEKLKQIELLRSVDPSYQKYYKDKANQYFIRAL